MKVKLLLHQLFFLSLSSLVYGHNPPSKTEVYGSNYKVAFYACSYVLEDYKWGTSVDAYIAIFNYTPCVGSLLHCIGNQVGYNTKAFNQSLAKVVENANGYYNMSLDVDYLRNQYTNATLYILNTDDVNVTSTVLYAPIDIRQDTVSQWSNYLTGLYFNFDFGSVMGVIMNAYWFLFLSIIAIGNFIKRLGFHRGFHNKYVNWYRANFSIPALFNGKHTEDHKIFKFYTTLIPTRVESIAVVLFFALNGILLGVNMNPHFDYSLNNMTYMEQLNVFMADRTGLLSFGLIPLLILFAGRNNLLTSITGLPFTSFITFHKWISRLMWIHALIHSACWTSYGISKGYLTYYETEAYWRWGIAATIIGGLLLFQAARIFRNLSYEMFLIVHIIFAIGFIVACYYHCYSLGWLEWLYASIAVWFVDRLQRIVRMTLFGFPYADIENVGQDTFKVTVSKGRWFNPFPGAFAYLYFISPKMFWESHPFTIIQSIEDESKTLVFIKTKKGITKKITERIEKETENGILKMRVCLEGPYGHRAPLDKYDTALILAGGNGIPGPLSYALDLGSKNCDGKQHVKFVWVIRTTEFLSWFSTELTALAKYGVDTHIYITSGIPEKKAIFFDLDSSKKRGTSSGSDTASIVQSDSELLSNLKEAITFHSGRPNIEELVHSEFTDENNGSIGVLTCGAPIMADNIRASIANNLQKCKYRVDLFEELQVW